MRKYIIGILLSSIAYAYSPIEMVPYRIVPMTGICDMEIEFVDPINLDSMYQRDKVELVETLKERVIFELAVPFARNLVFYIGDKAYYLIQIPYDGADWKR